MAFENQKIKKSWWTFTDEERKAFAETLAVDIATKHPEKYYIKDGFLYDKDTNERDLETVFKACIHKCIKCGYGKYAPLHNPDIEFVCMYCAYPEIAKRFLGKNCETCE